MENSGVGERRVWWPRPGERAGMSICTELPKHGQPVSKQTTPINTLIKGGNRAVRAVRDLSDINKSIKRYLIT